jgi:hypothetical protein
MSQDSYFKKFPVINYNNSAAVDLTKRIVFLDNILKNPYLFYPYEIQSSERADQFSYRYYNDQYKSWIVYLGNQIVDPYYEWYMDYDTFNQFIFKKYGNVELAQQKIKHYACNWENADAISISQYEALPITLVKYWEADYQNSNKIMGYKRKKIDQIMNTNSVRSYTVQNTGFKIDEICNIIFDDLTVGTGQVVSEANNTLYVQHTMGTTISTVSSGSYIYGVESKVNTHFTSCRSIMDNMLPEEEVYWYPVTYYAYEENKNAYNKTLKVLDKNYAKTVADNLTDVLK